ncbi:hypothetical protein FQN60_001665, partial [Etheostoma spectabile]
MKSVNANGREVLIEVVRVVWCKNHETCQETPSLYDSQSQTNDPRYRYLGDKKGDCTLQISDLQKEEGATYRFRMEMSDPKASFTAPTGLKVKVVAALGQCVNYPDQVWAVKGSTVTLPCSFTPLKSVNSGRGVLIEVVRVAWCRRVRVRVLDGARMEIRSSRDDGEFERGEAVTLNCSAGICTIHQLEVTWFRDGSALPESGPTLYLGYLTAKDSGNYTCGLKMNNSTLSTPYSLHVEAEEEDDAQMEIRSSRDDGEFERGEASDPTLYLGYLTAKDSGNYTCGLKRNNGTLSAPYSLHVGAEEEAFNMHLAVRLLIFTLQTVLFIIVTSIVLK